MNIFRTLFGEVTAGRLQRLPYLGYSILLIVAFLAIGFGLVAAIAGAESFVGGDIQQTQKMLVQRFGGIAAVAIVLLGLALMFAYFNLMAKRIRDIGLPVLLTLLVIIVLTGAVTTGVSHGVNGGMNSLVWLALVLIPSNAFKRSG